MIRRRAGLSAALTSPSHRRGIVLGDGPMIPREREDLNLVGTCVISHYRLPNLVPNGRCHRSRSRSMRES
jgi:hypothetical protein